MKATLVLLASFAGLALAAPQGQAGSDGCATPAGPAGPTPGSPEDICIQASAKLFDQCNQSPQKDEPVEALKERCSQQLKESKERCLGGGGAALEQCKVKGNRAFADCMKARVLEKSGKTKEDCEKERTQAAVACT